MGNRSNLNSSLRLSVEYCWRGVVYTLRKDIYGYFYIVNNKNYCSGSYETIEEAKLKCLIEIDNNYT